MRLAALDNEVSIVERACADELQDTLCPAERTRRTLHERRDADQLTLGFDEQDTRTCSATECSPPACVQLIRLKYGARLRASAHYQDRNLGMRQDLRGLAAEQQP